jgi:non-reducing end alpha-L-arabinofuranosidase
MQLEIVSMNKIRPAATLSVALSLGVLVASCMQFSSGGSTGTGGSGDGNGGSTGSGGIGDTGGSTGSGGTSNTGGSTGSGGIVGSGGTPGTGGTPGSGGTPGTGGLTGSGGAAGKAGTGGTLGSGGTSATGGAPGSGGAAGKAGSGGTPGTGGTPATGGTTGTGGTPALTGPCDVLAAAGNACVAAHSTVRALYGSYTGNLYQVCKGSFTTGPNSCKGTTKDIGVLAGFADSASQDAFCSGGTCTISIIYDQSPNANHLKPAPGGGAVGTPDNPANATDLKTTLSGHAVYGILIKPGMGYRAGCTGCGVVTPKGTATGDAAETQYMVTSQNNLIDGCCFDYGNAETDSHDDGNGTMEAVYFGGGVVWGTGSPGGHNNGPWVEADLENGLFAGWDGDDQNIATNTPLKLNYVTAVVVGDVASQNSGKGRFALYGADATTGAVTTMYDGIRPAKTGYVPMHKQGSIILGIGGDNSNSAGGQFFEGVMAGGAASLATVNALQANIVAAKYGK